MANLIGEFGGFAMLALLAALALRFLREILPERFAPALESAALPLLEAMLLGSAYFALSGLYRHFFVSTEGAWSLPGLWGVSRVSLYACFLLTAAGAALLGRADVLLLPFAHWLFIVPVAAGAFFALCAVKAALPQWKLPRIPYFLYPILLIASAFALFGGLR